MTLAGFFFISSGVPTATICPPASPPPGPISIMKSALLYVFCPVFIKLFTQNTEVIDIGVSVLRICAPFYALYSFTEVLSGAVKGSGEGLMPMIITVFTVCIMRLVWIWTVVPHFCTIQTVTLSYPITWALSSFVLILYYMNYSKRKFH